MTLVSRGRKRTQFHNAVPYDAADGIFFYGLVLFGKGAPTANPGIKRALYADTVAVSLYLWNGSAWSSIAGGGGPSVSSSFQSGNYGNGVQPNFTPPGTFGGAKDTVTGQLWIWDGVSWA
jgi:hypothetical protein